MKANLLAAIGVLGALGALAAPSASEPHPPRPRTPAEESRWPTDRVELRNGKTCDGLIESEDDAWLYLAEIRRPPGRAMYLLIRPIDRSSVVAVKRLDPAERARLQQRIEQWVNRARIELGKMEAVELSVVQRDRMQFQTYHGKWFDLESSSDAETTKRMIVRIEQMFTAYRQLLPPRTEPRRRLRLVILASLNEYQAHLGRYGLAMQNPAVFIEKENLVIAASEIARYSAEMAKVKAQHDRVREELIRIEQRLKTTLDELGRKLQDQGLPRGEISRILLKERRKWEDEIKELQEQIRRYARENAAAFDTVTRQMFARLYHEAFHAYLENYVYPRAEHDVPAWLGEGLAMVFEGGVLDSDTLRIDAPNPQALKQLQAELRNGRAMPLEELLSATPKDFLVVADTTPIRAQRLYGYAWGLVYYLTFEKHLLGTPALDRYVAPSSKDSPPPERLEKLTGSPLRRLQSDWRQYMAELR